LQIPGHRGNFLDPVVTLRSDARLVDFLEATYSLERSDEDWLTLALGALSHVCGEDRKYLGFFYDASNVEQLKIWNQVRLEPSIAADTFWIWGTFLNVADSTFVRATLRSLFVGSARKSAIEHFRPILEIRERHGHGDFIYLNALDPSGYGCVLTVGVPEREFTTDAKTAALFKRMATHLSSAYRCRRRLGRAGESALTVRDLGARAEAIVDSSGRLVHAEGRARSKTSRDHIRSAALAIESVRVRRKQRHGRLAVEGWHPLTAARWTLVDGFEEGGRRYIVACENQVDAKGFDTFTDRERQIVVHAGLGLTNKEIAYTLGLSHATVRVLLARAAKRLGVSGRADLLAHPSLRALRPERVGGD
jgi:DNA-binding CsgD family transcriptional regulator